MKLIQILLVNDSLLISQIIKKILAADPEFSPIGWCTNGIDVEDYLNHHTPDVILMDIHMPRQDGVETTRKILSIKPIPILIVTATISRNMPSVFKMIQYGALDVTKPPRIPAYMNIDKLHQKELTNIGATFINKIKIISKLKSKVKLIKKIHLVSETSCTTKASSGELKPPRTKCLVAIGASTGGPKALVKILQTIPSKFPAAIVIIQHMDSDFLPSFISHLQQFTQLRLRKAIEGEQLLIGNVYVAYKYKHHLICNEGKTFAYRKEPEHTHIPSIDICFKSIGEVFHKNAMGVLLTGMGNDGATGLKNIRDRGGFTLSQDEKTSVIYGMPKAAFDLNASCEVLPLSHIGKRIVEYINIKNCDRVNSFCQ